MSKESASNSSEGKLSALPISTERLRLRPVRGTDLEQVHRLHSFAETAEYNTLGIPTSLDETKGIIEGWVSSNNNVYGRGFTFVVEQKDLNNFIGLIALKPGKERYRNAEVWYKFDPGFWNKGFATEALRAVVDFGFYTLGLHRIEAGCAVANTGSYRVMEKAGFIREGRKNQALPLESGWSDTWEYAILSCKSGNTR